MEKQTLSNQLTLIPNGHFVSLELCCDLTSKLKAEYRNNGYEVYKWEKVNAQKGCKYVSHSEKHRNSNMIEVIKNNLLTHPNGNFYLAIHTIQNIGNKTKYFVIKNGVMTNDNALELFVPSYNENDYGYRTININSIIKLNHKALN